jgi:hypothetical protein
VKGTAGILPRLAVCLVGAASAFVLAAWAERAITVWAVRLVRTGPPQIKRFGAAKLERLGPSGVEALLQLARDRTVVPLDGTPPVSRHLVPHDTVGDVALDALRRLREGRSAARAFEWCAGPGASHKEACEAWRRAELQGALEWWRSAKKKAAP